MLEKKLFSLYRTVLLTLVDQKIILIPYMILAFLQLLVLEILYFYPRVPLKSFFEPWIVKQWGQEFMHYPNNLFLLPDLFRLFQIPFVIIFGMFFISLAIYITSVVNQGETVKFGTAVKKTLGRYFHILAIAAIWLVSVWWLNYGYELIYQRALEIQSNSGKFYYLKQLIIQGKPYFSLTISAFVTCLLGYTLPIINIDRKNFLVAFFLNFKVLFSSFFYTFFMVFLPIAFYSIILVLRQSSIADSVHPEWAVITLGLTVIGMTLVDAFVYTCLTIFYLHWKENK